MKELITMMQNNYRARLFKLFVVRASSVINFLWNIVKHFLEEFTTAKINLCTNNFEVLYETIPNSKIETTFGGQIPEISEEDSFPPKYMNVLK